MTAVLRHGVMTLRSSSELEIRSSRQIFQHTQSMKTKLLIILAILALASVDTGLAGGYYRGGYGRGYYGGRRYYSAGYYRWHGGWRWYGGGYNPWWVVVPPVIPVPVPYPAYGYGPGYGYGGGY
jgi:hypothetical protein